MKSKITFLILLFSVAAASAQNYIHKVIVLNEGHYDYINQVQTVPVTIGAYDTVSHLYQQFDVIQDARFATCVVTDGNSIYAAADSFIIRYDINTYQLLSVTTMHGVRKLAVWNNQLLASRGEYLMTFNSYFSVFDKNTLLPLYDLPVANGPQYSTEGIVVNNNKAYVAINNGFEWGNEKGLIGIVDLNTQTYLSEIDLGPTGKNPEYMALLNNQIITVNNRDFTAASISSVDISSTAVNTVDLGIASGCGGSVLVANEIYYQPSSATHLGKFSTQTMSNTGTLSINKNIYGMAHDDINNLVYMGETDYLTWGKIFIYQPNGTVIDSFDVSVAPGNIAFDIRSVAGVGERDLESIFFIYPNPAGSEFSIFNFQLPILSFEIFNALGQRVFSKQQTTNDKIQTVNVSSLSPGVYMLSIKTDEVTLNRKFIKQ
ncbi:MAG TPA: T9SS type A sorting domain-containing protein [Bacteroidia bacterium]|nr:T9SS type A sorting domain-containing protein [Bacteroidia bacterium]